MTDSLRAVAVMAAALPYLNAMRLKNRVIGMSDFIFPIVLAALRRETDKIFAPWRILFPITFPPVIFLFGDSRNQLANALEELNFEMLSPTSLINTNNVL